MLPWILRCIAQAVCYFSQANIFTFHAASNMSRHLRGTQGMPRRIIRAQQTKKGRQTATKI